MQLQELYVLLLSWMGKEGDLAAAVELSWASLRTDRSGQRPYFAVPASSAACYLGDPPAAVAH